MANSIRGVLSHISAVETLTSKTTGNSFKKQSILLDCSRHDYFTGAPQYENIIQLDFINKAVDKLAGFKVGEIVEVSFVIQGKSYTKADGSLSRFISLSPYDVKRVREVKAEATPAAAPTAAPAPAPAPTAAPPQVQTTQQASANVDDDLPF